MEWIIQCVSSGLYLSGQTIMSGIDTTYNSCVLYMQRERESLQLSIDKNQLQGQYASFNDSARSQEQSKQQDYGQENSYVIS